MVRQNILLVFLIVLFQIEVNAQDNDIYFGNIKIKSYDDKEYKSEAQIWDIMQDNKGVMYFASRELLEFDGLSWKRFPVANNTVIRSFDQDNKGRIYVGAVNEFGYFEPDSLGELAYFSLSNYLPDSIKSYNDIWKTHITTHGVYFISRSYTFRWYKNALEYQKIELGAFFSYKINDKIYVKLAKKGIAEINNFIVKEFSGCDSIYENTSYVFIDSLSDNQLLVTTRWKGSYIYNLKKQTLQKYKLDLFTEKYLKENLIFTSLVLDSNTIAYSTVLEGIIITDIKGNLKKIINTNRGLQSNCVYTLYYDKDKNLWAGTQNGIARIDLSYPATTYAKNQGLNDYVLDFLIYDSIQYISTTNQLFYLPQYIPKIKDDNHKLIPISDIYYSWDIFKLKNKLFATYEKGIAQIINNKAINIYNRERIYFTKYSSKYSDKLFLFPGEGVRIVDFYIDNNSTAKINNEQSIKGIMEEIHSMAFDQNGNLWLQSESLNLIYIRFHDNSLSNYTITKFSGNNGLPDNLNALHVARFNNKINFFTSKGIFKPIFPKKNESDSLIKFIHDDYWGTKFTSDSGSISFIKQIDNSRFLIKSDEVGIYTIKKDTSIFESHYFKRLEAPYKFRIENNRFIQFGTPDAFLVYDIKKKKKYNQKFRTLIRNVSIANDSVIFKGIYFKSDSNKAFCNYQTEYFKPVLNYQHNSIKVEFASNFYEEAQKTKYQYKLIGFEKEWSKWTTENKAKYTNIPEGNYTFSVKAKNIYGFESLIAEYQFKVLPPWYRTWWAYIFYLIGASTFIYLLIYLNLRRLKAANARLDKIVKERTAELRKKNAEIITQNEELKTSREEIMAQRDAIEEKNIELEKLSIVASKTDNSVVIAEPDGEITWVNDGFEQMLGIGFEEFKREFGSNLFTSSLNKDLQDIVKKSIKNMNSTTYTCKTKRKNGQELWIQTNLTPIFDKNQKLSKLVAIDSDVTKIKQAENELKLKNELINGSIKYAQTIQKAILPLYDVLSEYHEVMIFFKPKDIVSGDFYWYAEMDNCLLYAVVDCTGHGVPGAFMSMIGSSLLNDIVKQRGICSPAEILKQLNIGIEQALRQKDTDNKDGMDMSLCRLEKKSDKLIFAGAKQTLYVYQNTQIKKTKGTRRSIGGIQSKRNITEFENKELKVQKNDIFYMCTDGYSDQNNIDRKRFGSAKLETLFSEIASKSFNEQKQIIENKLYEYMKGTSQRDDITILCVKI